MGIVNELSTIKTEVSDKVVSNKVSRFAYTEQAYTDNDADGVNAYDVNAQQNIPVGTASVMKVNQTVIEKGWRARASSITRMLMNHFLGRMSYNLNKANDLINSILNLLVTYIGSPDGIASLDSSGRVPVTQINKSNVGIPDGTNSFTTKGAYDYSLGSVTASSWLGKVFGRLLCRVWRNVATTGIALSTPCHANGLWVAGSSSVGMWWSKDGKNWTQGTGTGDISIYTPTYNNGLWIAGSSTHGIWWSEDGKAWTQGTGAGTTISIASPVYADGLWISSEGWWSEDGKAWTEGTGIITDSAYVPVYAGNLWVAGSSGDRIMWSENGKSWTQGTGISASASNVRVAYHDGLWIASTYSGVYSSTDGKTWTIIDSLSTSATWSGIAYVRDKWFLSSSWKTSSQHYPEAYGLWCSADGETWEVVSDFHNWSTIVPVFGNGLFVTRTVSYGTTFGGAYYSENGINWQRSESDLRFNGAMVFADGMWITSTLGSNLAYSDAQMLMEDGTLTD